MNQPFHRTRLSATLAGASLAVLAAIAPASAQQTEADESGEDEIVVTGTLVRGVAPAGAQVTGVTSADIEASGATITDQILSSIPQISNMFGGLNAVGIDIDANITAGGELTTNRYFQSNVPQVRGLSTLVLVDGRRLASSGGTEVIPPAAIERVEVVPDGGSSIYGADAVGGVINFITRRSYDGIGVDGSYGFGDEYENFNGSITAGHDWGSGSVFGTINYDSRSEVLGRDRDYIQGLTWSTLVPYSRNCEGGTVTVGGVSYAVTPTGLGAAGTFNACDHTDNQSMAPEEERTNIMVGLTQELTDSIEFGLRAYHSERESHAHAGALGSAAGTSALGDVNIGPTNPYYRPRFVGDTATQRVQFNYASISGNDAATRDTEFNQWGISPTLRVDLGEWQLNLLANYDRNETGYLDLNVRAAAQTAAAAGTTLATALNPYNPAVTDPAVLAGILNWQDSGTAERVLTNYRAVFDGPLIDLPGGTVRAAIGAEFIKEEYEARSGQSVIGGGNTLPLRTYEREVDALFGEIQIPIVGPQNNVPGVESLRLALSARRDNYSDFGETTNPRVGLTYEPTDWLSFRANWGESFVAPSTSAGAASGPPVLRTQSLPYFLAGDAPLPGQVSIVKTGAVRDLQPQEATTWSYGVDVQAPFLSGLRGSVTYYNVDFRGVLGVPPIFSPSTFYRDFVGYYSLHPTAAEIQAYANDSGDPNALNTYVANPALVYQLLDYRQQNLGSLRQEGVDFSVNYDHDLGFGALSLGFSGNYALEEARAVSAAAAFTETDLERQTRLRYTAFAGLTIDNLYARASFTYNGGFDVTRSATLLQDEVRAFEVVDLYFRYDLGDLGLAEDLSVSLNVNNALDKAPPILRSNGTAGIDNGGTLGRVVSLGFNARF